VTEYPPTWYSDTLADLRINEHDRIYWLQRATRKAERDYTTLQQSYLSAVASNWTWQYPPIPPPMIRLRQEWQKVPTSSGVYFIWREGGLAYVGESVNLKQRLTCSHERVEDGDDVSWLLFPEHALTSSEAFYIGIGRPWSNGRAKKGLKSLSAKTSLKQLKASVL
jgi:hypothetical protein